GFGYQQRAEPVRRDDQAAHGLERGRIRERRPAGHLRQFAEELTRTMCNDFAMLAEAVVLGDLDLAARDDNEAGSDLAGGEELVARLENTALAEPAHPLDLERFEIGEHLIVPPLAEGLLRRRHADSND